MQQSMETVLALILLPVATGVQTAATIETIDITHHTMLCYAMLCYVQLTWEGNKYQTRIIHLHRENPVAHLS